APAQVLLAGPADADRVAPVRRPDVADQVVAELVQGEGQRVQLGVSGRVDQPVLQLHVEVPPGTRPRRLLQPRTAGTQDGAVPPGRSEAHTSELQSPYALVCR